MAVTWKETFIFLLVLVQLSISKLVKERIYEAIEGSTACFKRFNATHEIGCTSNFWGNVGVVHVISNENDVKWVIEKGSNDPYILAVKSNLFDISFLKTVSQSEKINGIVLLHSKNSSRPDFFSVDEKCPNKASSLYLNSTYQDYCDENPWNPNGSGLMFQNWDFPLFLVYNDEDIKKILSCFETYNKPASNDTAVQWPLCSMELKSHMSGTTSTEVCMKRRRSQNQLFTVSSYCDPLADINIWTSLSPIIGKESNDDSIIFVSTAADASSMFDQISPGADQAVSGLVLLLATAEALFKYKHDFIDSPKNVLFTIFEGESWDYIGSSRMAYDIDKGKFPLQSENFTSSALNFSHIHSFIEIGQVGLASSEQVFLHSDPISNANDNINTKTKEILDKFVVNSNGKRTKFIPIMPSKPLPPSSLQSFLKYKNISGVVLADHQQKFRNQFYQTIYDDDRNLNYMHGQKPVNSLSSAIAKYASILGSTLYEMVAGIQKDIKANETLVDELLHCYLQNSNCTYFREHSDENLVQLLVDGPAKMYVSVFPIGNKISHVTRRILTKLTGEKVSLNKTACYSNFSTGQFLEYFPFIDNGTCFKSNVHTSPAMSPAFLDPKYDWSSGKYSSWAESEWKSIEARIFLMPSHKEEILLATFGLINLFLSFALVNHINSKSNVIFS